MAPTAESIARLPAWNVIAKRISDLITERDGEWCGFPMPIKGLGLVVEDKYPKRELLEQVQDIVNGDQPPIAHACSGDDMGWHVVNSWRSAEKGGTVLVLHHEDGRTSFAVDHFAPRRNRFWLGPLETLDAWNLETELTAIDRLSTLLAERMFAAYVLTGTFLETSKRSGLTYLFRRCRPTLVLTPNGGGRNQFKRGDQGSHGSEMRILTALCLHPIGYYANTFAGAMTPTDDVIAHLLLMRGDEHLFWRRSNQHHPMTPEAGL